MMEHGMNRSATIAIRPGYEFNVRVTEDLVFPGPYKD
jgi:type IV secretory pathway VirB10-like protein